MGYALDSSTTLGKSMQPGKRWYLCGHWHTATSVALIQISLLYYWCFWTDSNCGRMLQGEKMGSLQLHEINSWHSNLVILAIRYFKWGLAKSTRSSLWVRMKRRLTAPSRKQEEPKVLIVKTALTRNCSFLYDISTTLTFSRNKQTYNLNTEWINYIRELCILANCLVLLNTHSRKTSVKQSNKPWLRQKAPYFGFKDFWWWKSNHRNNLPKFSHCFALCTSDYVQAELPVLFFFFNTIGS